MAHERSITIYTGLLPDLLLSFFGDDFTGSTDALESLALAGVPTVLFTEPPTPAQLARYPHIRAFGIAGMTRAMPPAQMRKTLLPALQSLKNSGASIVHYKVCSTFDSSPEVGSIGQVIDTAAEIFRPAIIPVVVGGSAARKVLRFRASFCPPRKIRRGLSP